ncbi:MAG: hypothetical protein JWR22_110 [Herminiimonas sp.]|nr:hypothetical protein [Herminiimonas sp.]
MRIRREAHSAQTNKRRTFASSGPPQVTSNFARQCAEGYQNGRGDRAWRTQIRALPAVRSAAESRSRLWRRPAVPCMTSTIPATGRRVGAQECCANYGTDRVTGAGMLRPFTAPTPSHGLRVFAPPARTPFARSPSQSWRRQYLRARSDSYSPLVCCKLVSGRLPIVRFQARLE